MVTLITLLFLNIGPVDAPLPLDPPDILTYHAADGSDQPVTNLAEWEHRRGQILEAMEEVMGPLPDRSQLPPLNPQFKDTLETESYTRYTVYFTAAEEEIVPAYLYIPFRKSITGKHPAMMVLHGTGAGGKRLVDGESHLANRAQAKELAERGYGVIAPDYTSMGELADYDFDADRYVSATMKGIFNHMRCVDLLQERPDVDPERIGVLGHSLGGHNSMFVGAFDPRLKVIVTSSGWTQMRSEEHTSELQSRGHLVCRLLLEKKEKVNFDARASSTRIINDIDRRIMEIPINNYKSFGDCLKMKVNHASKNITRITDRFD